MTPTTESFTPETTPTPAPDTDSPTQFAGTIVALGASAGGLDALDRFFAALPPLDGAAFVVIQHLAPEHRTMMDTLLARHTSMQVLVASEGLPLQSRHVYVIPPGAMMTVAQGRLRLAPRPTTGLTLPIDAFFDSLALEAASRAIGIVLSGTGSDGTRGAQSLDAAGAWVLAQDPESAKFDGMPRSVIAGNAVDQVLPPEALAAEVAAIIASGEVRPARGAAPGARGDLTIEPVLRLLSATMRVDFSQYKPNTTLRRVERRMSTVGSPSFQAYADHLSSHPDEVELLRQELLIPVTRFFRDGDAFDALRDRGLVPLIQARAAENPFQPLRVWVVATATGQEAYSVAMLVSELIEAHAPGLPLKLFATDVEPTYLERAALGAFSEADMAGVSDARRDRWFQLDEGQRWRVRAELRQRIVFTRHDLLSDAPFTQLDLVCCRNLLIYFRPAAQDRAVRRLAYALRRGGVLFLGTSESPTAAAGLFESLDGRQKVFRLQRRASALPPEDLLQLGGHGRFRASPTRADTPSPSGRPMSARASELLVAKYAPAAMLLTAERELVHTFGDMRRLLRFREGGASLDALTLLPPSLMTALATLIHSALRHKTPQRSLPLRVVYDDDADAPEHIRVAVWPMDPDGTRIEHLLVCFEVQDHAAAADAAVLDESALTQLSARHVLDLEQELERTRANLQDSLQELGTTNEELQATNEELMASNEELQSTNEELQSVNEELHTVNAELQSKVVDLNDANADLESLSRAARIPLVFLDADLRMTRFTSEASSLFRVRDGDVGRPITDFRHALDYPGLQDDLVAAARHGARHQREVRDEDGRYWLVTVLPYASPDQRRTRVVITCVDVSSLRDVERLQRIMDALPEHVAVLDPGGGIVMVNRSWRDFAARNGDESLLVTGPGCNYLEVCRRSASSDETARHVLQGLSEVLQGSRPAFMMFYPCHSPAEDRWFLLHAGPLQEGGCVVTHFNMTGWVDPTRLPSLVGEPL